MEEILNPANPSPLNDLYSIIGTDGFWLFMAALATILVMAAVIHILSDKLQLRTEESDGMVMLIQDAHKHRRQMCVTCFDESNLIVTAIEHENDPDTPVFQFLYDHEYLPGYLIVVDISPSRHPHPDHPAIRYNMEGKRIN